MWFAIAGDDGRRPGVVGPVDEFQAAAGEACRLPAHHRAIVVEWSIVCGLLAIWSRCGDRWELTWEASAADELRARADRPIDFEARAEADERRRASKRVRKEVA